MTSRDGHQEDKSTLISKIYQCPAFLWCDTLSSTRPPSRSAGLSDFCIQIPNDSHVLSIWLSLCSTLRQESQKRPNLLRLTTPEAGLRFYLRPADCHRATVCRDGRRLPYKPHAVQMGRANSASSFVSFFFSLKGAKQKPAWIQSQARVIWKERSQLRKFPYQIACRQVYGAFSCLMIGL